MSRIFVGSYDVEPQVEVATHHDRAMSGGDQLLAKDVETVAWLAKVYGEIAHGSRPWTVFDQKRLRNFLNAVGVDTDAAVKAHADTMPTPRCISNLELCVGKLKGASFLNAMEQEACLLIDQVSQRSPHRR